MIPILALLLLVLAAASLLAGKIWPSPADMLTAIADPQPGLAQIVIREVRLSRLALGLLVGRILGLSGAVLQGLLRNPLLSWSCWLSHRGRRSARSSQSIMASPPPLRSPRCCSQMPARW